MQVRCTIITISLLSFLAVFSPIMGMEFTKQRKIEKDVIATFTYDINTNYLEQAYNADRPSPTVPVEAPYSAKATKDRLAKSKAILGFEKKDIAFELSLRYLTGNGVKPDKTKVVNYLKAAADAGHDIAQQIFVTTNPQQLFLLGNQLKETGKLGCAFYCYYAVANHEAVNYESLPSMTQVQNEYSAFNELCSVACEEKVSDEFLFTRAQAQNCCGLAYLNEEGINKDLNKAIEYFQKAGDNNFCFGYYNIAYMYEYGIEVTKNLNKAFEYYKKAVKLNHDPNHDNEHFKGLQKLSKLCEHGTKSDLSLSLNYLEKAYELAKKNNHPETSFVAFEISLKYLMGSGVAPDKTKASEYLKAAAYAGHYNAYQIIMAQENPKQLLSLGKQLRYLHTQSLYCFYMLANQEKISGEILPIIAEAQNCCGSAYLNGEGINKDLNKAVEYFQKASGNNFCSGYYNLAYMYEYGTGVTKNFSKAFEYYKKAVDTHKNCTVSDHFLDHVQQLKKLSGLYKNGIGVEQNQSLSAIYLKQVNELIKKYQLI